MLGERIRQRRTDLHLSQTQLAKRLHVTPGAVSQWEKGLTRPTFETLDMLANILDTTMSYLLGSTDDPKRLTIEEMAKDYEEEMARALVYWSLDEEQRSDPARRGLFLLAKNGKQQDVQRIWAVVKALQTVE